MDFPRRILGIDPGTRLLGYGMIEAKSAREFAYIECGVIKLDPTLDFDLRLLALANEVEALIREFEPRELAIECAFHGQNASSALKLAEARGAIKVQALSRGLRVAQYAPAQVKLVVAGKGRATKAEVIHRAALCFGLRRPPASDAADALALALCQAIIGREHNSTSAQGPANA
jgi:crossover junction endodeoxyribonuclease RuvC